MDNKNEQLGKLIHSLLSAQREGEMLTSDIEIFKTDTTVSLSGHVVRKISNPRPCVWITVTAPLPGAERTLCQVEFRVHTRDRISSQAARKKLYIQNYDLVDDAETLCDDIWSFFRVQFNQQKDIKRAGR